MVSPSQPVRSDEKGELSLTGFTLPLEIYVPTVFVLFDGGGVEL
jgi:hypothetical protein